MRALIDQRDGTIVQSIDGCEEFPVAAPFFWGDVPDDAVPRSDTWNEDGSLTKAILRPQSARISNDAMSEALTVITFVWARGDGLPEHVHEDQGHTTDVLRGSIAIIRNSATEHYIAGQSTSFAVGEPHSITATADNTVIVNITDQSNP